MPKMVCTQCQRELAPLKNGVIVVEMMGPNSHPHPYKIWEADLWKCATCDTRIVAGFATEPVAKHYQAGFGVFARRALEGSATWILFDYENAEQRQAGAALGYKNLYGVSDRDDPEKMVMIEHLLAP